MQKIILQKDVSNHYICIQETGDTIWLLVYFLQDTQLINFDFYLDWALHSTQMNLGYGNKIGIKKNDTMIFIHFLFSDEPDEGPFFIISISEFAKLLNEWKKLAEIKTSQITITEDNGVIRVQGDSTLN